MACRNLSPIVAKLHFVFSLSQLCNRRLWSLLRLWEWDVVISSSRTYSAYSCPVTSLRLVPRAHIFIPACQVRNPRQESCDIGTAGLDRVMVGPMSLLSPSMARCQVGWRDTFCERVVISSPVHIVATSWIARRRRRSTFWQSCAGYNALMMKAVSQFPTWAVRTNDPSRRSDAIFRRIKRQAVREDSWTRHIVMKCSRQF